MPNTDDETSNTRRQDVKLQMAVAARFALANRRPSMLAAGLTGLTLFEGWLTLKAHEKRHAQLDSSGKASDGYQGFWEVPTTTEVTDAARSYQQDAKTAYECGRRLSRFFDLDKIQEEFKPKPPPAPEAKSSWWKPW